jgi:hypothetical protein
MSGAKPDFYDFTMGHVRLTGLRALVESPNYSANDSVLAQTIESVGLPVTRDQLRTQLGWLDEQGLIQIRRASDTLMVAVARERGVDVALGRAAVDGVQRPGPGR